MKIHITKKGMTVVVSVLALILACILIVGVSNACDVIKEFYSVWKIPNIDNEFKQSNINYNDKNSLQESLKKYRDEIKNKKDELEKLEKTYPDNETVTNKLSSYRKHLEHLESFAFTCPEHCKSPCPACGGDGKGRVFGACNRCKGTKVDQKCSNCGGTYKNSMKIPAKKLLGE